MNQGCVQWPAARSIVIQYTGHNLSLRIPATPFSCRVLLPFPVAPSSLDVVYFFLLLSFLFPLLGISPSPRPPDLVFMPSSQPPLSLSPMDHFQLSLPPLRKILKNENQNNICLSAPVFRRLLEEKKDCSRRVCSSRGDALLTRRLGGSSRLV